MMISKRILVLAAACSAIVFSHPLQAQVEQSVYSMFGVGQLYDNGFGINKTLGGTGIAFQSERSVNYSNPASYLGILPNSLNLELGAYGIYGQSQHKKTLQRNGDFNFSDFSLSLCLTKWWAFCFGITPFSSVSYEIHSSGEIEGDLVPLEKTFTGTGGLNRVFFGNSYRIYRGLAVGFNASYIFGPITQTETAESNDNFAGYELINKRVAHGLYLDYGLQYSVRHDDWLVTLGLIYGDSRTINTTDKRQFTYDETTYALKQDKQWAIRIPRKFGFGVSVNKVNHFRVGFDYEWKNWSTIRFSNPNLDVRNSERFSMGMEYIPAQTGSWFKRLHYRLGANDKKSYLVIDHKPINSRGINFGVGIPSHQVNMLNFSLEYGEEGTLSKGLIKNDYWLFYISYSIHQLMAVRNYL